MRLEHLCDMELAEQSAGPLAQPECGEEVGGLASNGGTASGEQLYGTVQWVQSPQWFGEAEQLADMQVLLTTAEGVQVSCALHGRPADCNPAQGVPGRYVFLVRFAVEDARYQWLTPLLCLAEGLIFPASQHVQLRLYACVHELSSQMRP